LPSQCAPSARAACPATSLPIEHIGWKKGNAFKEYQKRKETLAQSLAAFFGIKGEPIALDGKDWKCCFRVVATDD
jgi:uncharacterized Zn-binding protein involved in type VI secretion